eukprot:ANDGO_04771.mRNA.1 Lysophospholipid acyltransferase LPEAT2
MSSTARDPGLSHQLSPKLRPIFSTNTLIQLDSSDDDVQRTVSVQAAVEENILRDFQKRTEDKTSFHLSDLLPFFHEGVEAIVQDDFTESFASKPPPAWNFSSFLFPLWLMGWCIRHFILFPLRVFVVVVASIVTSTLLLFYALVLKKKESPFLFKLIQWYSKCWLFSFSTILRVHGQRPPRRPNQIYVSNHTSPVDYIVLLGLDGCATVGQRHSGFVGFFQKHILFPLHNIWFERFEAADRHTVATRMKHHAANADLPPLLLFPEGVCVNNEYCVMFRKGAFELGVEVIPCAIKYDKMWADPYWNSKEESFPKHLYRLMTGWCLFVDFHYLEPTTLQPNENPAEFAERVKSSISEAAELISVSWDGYYKYYQPTAKFVEQRQKAFANVLVRRMSPVASEEKIEEEDRHTKQSLRKRH